MEGNPQVLCRLTGPIAVENVRTRNGTIYGSRLWDAVEQSEEFKEMMDNKSFYIGLDHPESTERDSLCSRLRETAGIVSSWVRQSDGVIKVIIDVLDTPFGRIVNTLARYGSYIGLSTRAEGDTDAMGNVKADTFDFFGADFVTVPSQKASRMRLVLEEGLKGIPKKKDLVEAYNYIKNNKHCQEVAKRLKSSINNKEVPRIMEGRLALRGSRRVGKLIESKLNEKGYARVEGGFMRNLLTGEDTKILQESSIKGEKSFVLRDGHEIRVMLEGCGRKRMKEGDCYDEYGNPLMEEDDIICDEYGNPIVENMDYEEDPYMEGCGRKRIESEEEDDYIDEEDDDYMMEGTSVGKSGSVTSGPRYSSSKNKMLAKKLEKCLENEMEDGEFVTDEEKDVVLVEGKNCSIRVKGSVLSVYKGRRMTERYQLERGDSLVESIRKIRRMYSR